jgi:hypothetical protein
MPACPKCGTEFEVARWSRTKFKKGAYVLSRCNGCDEIITAYIPWYLEWPTYLAPLFAAFLALKFANSLSAIISTIIFIVTWAALINPLFLPFLFKLFGRVKISDHV